MTVAKALKVRYSRQTDVVVECKEDVFVERRGARGNRSRAAIAGLVNVAQRIAARLDCRAREQKKRLTTPTCRKTLEGSRNHFFGGGGLGVPVVS